MLTVGAVGAGSGRFDWVALGLGTDGEEEGEPETGAEGASAAFKVTRTVSFFSGTLEVCDDGLFSLFSFSLMVDFFEFF